MAPIAIDDASATSKASQNPVKAASLARKPWKQVAMSNTVASLRNPIREAVSGIDFSNPGTQDKPFINISLGDPSVYGNHSPPKQALDAIKDALYSGKADGYPQSVGYDDARQAVAEYFDEGPGGHWRVNKQDVYMTHGCSGALEMAITVLAEEGKNAVIPRPLFSAYETLLSPSKAEIRYYDLLPEQNFEVDLTSLESVIDDKTAFVLLNNPSNPCGSNWSESHVREIAEVIEKKQVVVLSDEVYAGLAWHVTGSQSSKSRQIIPGKFNRRLFTPFASVANTPCLVLGGLSKRWLAPGWRTGWIIVHDPIGGVLSAIREGLGRLGFRIQGPSSTVQRALPAILANTPEEFFEQTMDELERTGKSLFDRLAQIDGLRPVLPQGAMYLMCGGLTPDEFPEFANDAEWVAALYREENVLVLPGSAFRLDGFMRFVTTVPEDKLLLACDRIEAFCKRHRRRV